MDLAAALTRGVYEQGAEYFRLMIVATGERSVFPNVGPTDRILKNGDVCRVEIFPMIGGYHAGVCRTAAVGAPPPHAERIWANLTACKYLLLDAIKPGASSRAIYDLYLCQAEASSTCRRSRSSATASGCICTRTRISARPRTSRSKPAWCSASSRWSTRPASGSACRTRTWCWSPPGGCELMSDYVNTDKLIIVA